MAPVRAVVWFVLRRELRNPWLWIAIGAVTILAAIAVALDLRDVESRHLRYQRALQQLVQEQARPSIGLLGRQVEPMLRALRPPEPGTVIARGIDEIVPAYWDFGPGGRVPAPISWTEGLDSPAEPPLDLEFIIRVIGGLLALTLAVRVTAGDREAGLTRAFWGLPVKPSLLLAGRLIAETIILLGGLVLVGGGAMAGAAVGARDAEVVSALRNSLIAASPIAGAYLVFLLMVGALAGTALRREAAAYATGFAAWLMLAILPPQVATLATRMLVPVPAHGAMIAERDEVFAGRIREGEDALGRTVLDYRTDDGRTLDQRIQAHITDLDALWQPHAAEARAQAQLVEAAWTQRFTARQRAERWCEWLSPALSFTAGLADVAHTGWALQAEWDRLTADYQFKLDQQLFDNRPRVTVRVPSGDSVEILGFPRHPLPKLKDLSQWQVPSARTFSRTEMAWTMARLLLAAGLVLAITLWTQHRRGLPN